MKKIFAILLIAVLVICLGACSDGGEAVITTEDEVASIEKEIQGCWKSGNLCLCFKNGQYRCAIVDYKGEMFINRWSGGVYSVIDNQFYLLNLNGESDGIWELATVDGEMCLIEDDGDVFQKVPSTDYRVATMDALFEREE